MKLLIVSATEMEVAAFTGFLQQNTLSGHSVTQLVTSVGAIATAYSVTRALAANKYDLVLQAGVAGSFNRDIALGEVVQVMTERYGDLGAEDHDKYLDIFDMGLLGPNERPHKSRILYAPQYTIVDIMELPKVSGLSVSTVSGNEHTIARRKELYGCDIESMEGAAFHYVCLQMGVPFAQVRAISNYVVPRDKSQWKMREAVINLNNWLIDFTSRL